ncbi:MAG TPA: glycosyltransferase family 39 protein [Planctomycetota bacterium]|nr:glycosyltransferase family 39 protein [Planctomycetota bacterium]
MPPNDDPAPARGLPDWTRWLLALLPIRLLLAVIAPVLPEEAYHWNFARHLDWGYLDHPPMIAWAIAAGRLVAGDSALGIRLLPLLFSLGSSVLIARFARRLYGEAAATWAVILFTLAPIPFLVSEAGFPDSPLLFFWTLTLALGWEAVDGGKPGVWLAAGASLGAAMLSKYTAVLLVPSLFLYLLLGARDRRRLASPWPYLAGLVALAVFLPVIYWNWKHGWASFLYQSRGRFEESHGFSLGRYLRAQALAPFTLTLPLAACALVRLFLSTRPQERYLLSFFLPMFLLFAAVSCVRPPHLLWPLPCYVSVFVAMAGMAAEGAGPVSAFYARARGWLVGLSGVLLVGGGIHLAFFLPVFSPLQGPYGWKEVADAARIERQGLPDGSFYLGLGRKYTCTSQLAYQLRLPYEVHGANLIGEPALQYSYWSDAAQLRGRDAVIVIEGEIRSKATLELLQRRFASVEAKGEVVVPVGRSPWYPSPPLQFQIYLGRGFRPPAPK